MPKSAAAGVTPDYWDEACKHLARRDRVMKKLIPRFGEARLAKPRRPVRHAGPLDRRAADIRQGSGFGVGALLSPGSRRGCRRNRC